MNETEKADEDVEMDGEKTKLLAWASLEQPEQTTSSSRGLRPADPPTACSKETGYEKPDTTGAFRPGLTVKLQTSQENGNDRPARPPVSSSSTRADSGGSNNYGSIKKSESKEKWPVLLDHQLSSSASHRPLLGTDSDCGGMAERRYSAVSAPAVSLLTSIADEEETEEANRSRQERTVRTTTIRFEQTPKTKTTSITATSTAPDSTTNTDTACKKSADELRRVLTKRWDQLARHRLLVLHLIMGAYIAAFLIAYICVVQGNTRLSVILLLCLLMGYCSILVLLCVAFPLISRRSIFVNVASLITATVWPVLIWLLSYCCSEWENEDESHWAINGMPAVLLFTCALYGNLTFPGYIDAIWGLTVSIVHLVVTYVHRTPRSPAVTREVCANILLLLLANALNLFISLALRRSREFMWRQFDDSIEKRSTVEYEKERQEQLLLSIIPAHLAARVRKTILNRASKTRESIDTSAEQPRLFHDLHVQQHENVSILFADIVNFTPLTAELTAPQLVRFLNELYSRFDEIAQEYQCMRIKILGDCYYCVSGMPVSRPNHADSCVKMALAMIEAIKSLREAASISMDMRIGVHSGSVLCGILGLKKWQYDIWSDDVTIANHMEQSGRPGRVHITKATLQLLSGDYRIEPASSTDPYILAQRLETYYILPYSDSQTEKSGTPSSVEDIAVTVNGVSSALPRVVETSVECVDNKNKLKVTSTNNRPFDRAKSFSFRNPASTSVRRKERTPQRCLSPLVRKNIPSCESFITQQRQTGKMSKIIEFWGGADTPFSNLSRRRSSDYVRAASITAIENIYKQYRCRDLISLRSVRCTNAGRVCKLCPGGIHRRDSATAINLELDGTLTYNDPTIEESFYQSADPIPHAAATTAATVLTFFIGVIGSTCVLTSPDVAACVIFSAILLILALLSIFQWNRMSGRKTHYVPSLVSLDSYKTFSKRVVPTLVLILTLVLPIVFVMVCAQPEKCFNGKYHVCLFQMAILVIVCGCRPGFFSRSGLLLIFFTTFVLLFFYSSDIGDDWLYQWKYANYENGSYHNATERIVQSKGLTALPFELRAMFNLTALLFLVICLSWLIEYEAKVDWLCVASFRVEQEDVETMQDINMILLHNILPDHVAAHFLRPERPPEELYHENHAYVCVMFASIPNFKDFWSQWDFSRQLECLRLLNEIVCEFDKLLAKPKYSNVEKIKTVGSTYMAVCGLYSSPSMQLDPRRFAAIMVEFAFAMVTLLDQLNRDAFQNFQLRIGMSFGPVIAGVIGAQKPQYDIWGNTVNVASRMDTHGVMGKIHVTQDAAAALQACGYDVESRGLTKIKGIRNEVETYFVHPPSDKRSLAY